MDTRAAAVVRQDAQGLIEYGLIIALVALLAIGGLLLYGPAIGSMLSKVTGSV
jgi:Flp pilus assembly pilin Flp